MIITVWGWGGAEGRLQTGRRGDGAVAKSSHLDLQAQGKERTK